MWNHVNVVENQREWSSQTQIMSEFGTWWQSARPCCPFPAPPPARSGVEGVFTRKRTRGMFDVVSSSTCGTTGAESITFRLERYIPISMEIARYRTEYLLGRVMK